MAKKAMKQDLKMEIRKNKGRFFSIVLIVALGVAFFSGLRASERDMKYTADRFADDYNMMDLRVINTAGLSEQDVEALLKIEGIADAEGSYMLHALTTKKEQDYALELLAETEKINRIQVVEGRLPEADNECLLDLAVKEDGFSIGDTITLQTGTQIPIEYLLKETEFKVVGFGESPMYIGMERGSTNIGGGQLSGFCIVRPEVFAQEQFTQIYLTAEGAKDKTVFTEEYDALIETVQMNLEEERTELCQNRNDLPGYAEFGSNAERIGAIGKVFPAIFFLVAALVALTAMTRMIEEQRTQIGTYKALGYEKGTITWKYLSYALIASLLGSIFGVLIGEKLFPFVIIVSYRIMYKPVREIVIPYHLGYALYSIVLAVASTTIATFAACYKALSETPAVLMRPVAPKAGKRVFLERVGVIWNHISFSQKATLRNLFRYKKRLVMTVFGIGCCCGLMVVGFGLQDSIMKIASIQYDNIQLYDAMVSVEPGMTAEQSEALEKELTKENGVSGFCRVMMRSMDASEHDAIRTTYVVAAENLDELNRMITFRDRKTKEEYQLGEEDVFLTEQLASALAVSGGDSFLLKSGEEHAEPTVTHIMENYLMHYVYLSAEQYEALYHQAPAYNMYWLTWDPEQMEDETAFGTELMKLDGVQTVTYISDTRNSIETMLESLGIIVLVLVAAASLLAFVVIYNLNNINISERRRELATIKLLGFYDMETAMYVYRENIYLTIIGAIFGLGIGRVLHLFVINTIEVNQIMFGREITAGSYVICIVFTCVFAVLVNAVMYFQLKKIDMIESLKSVE